MPEPIEARVRDVSLTMSAVDGESLLSPQLMGRIVSAVLTALSAHEQSEAARRRDTHVDCGCDASGCHGGGEHA